MGSNSHAPCGLVTRKVLGPQGPLLTNRMSELLTYGSVGGVGGNPGPYPALDAANSSNSGLARKGLALNRFEPFEGKLSRTVLRGAWAG
jgi:hypothetical protein